MRRELLGKSAGNQATQKIPDHKASSAARRLADSNEAPNGECSNGRLGKASPGEKRTNITKKSSRLLVIENQTKDFGRVTARSRRCGLAGPAEVGEQCRTVEGDRSLRNKRGDGLWHLSVRAWGPSERVCRHWQGQVVLL